MKSVILGVLVVLSARAMAEDVQIADARNNGTEDGLYVVFVSQRVAPDNPVGFAAMAACRGEGPDALTVETAYGMLVNEGTPKLGPIAGDIIKHARLSSEGESTRTFVVKVDRAQYDDVVDHLQAFSAQADDPDLTPEALLHEATRIVILSIGNLKEPYRGGGRRAPDTQTYYEDLMVLNRDR